MAQYKVIQDIEAEDKLLGPFSFRQFVYLFVGVFFGFLCYTSLAKHVPFLLAIFLPPMLFCFFFAWPWSPDQPTEVWALARIRFVFKPRKRIWDQSGIKELVTVTAPKQIERIYTDGLSQTEVRSRLNALASTIDSRGWVVKDSNLNLAMVPQAASLVGSDRLVGPSNIPPQEIANLDVRADDDILDENRNPAAYSIEQKLKESDTARRQSLVERLKHGSEEAAAQSTIANWFSGNKRSATPAAPTMPAAPTPLPAAGPAAAAATMSVPAAPIAAPAPAPSPTGSPEGQRHQAKAAAKPKHDRKPADDTLVSGEEVMIQADQQAAAVVAPTEVIPEGETLTEELAAQPLSPETLMGLAGGGSLPKITLDDHDKQAVQSIPDPAIMNLISDNNSSIATLAREAQQARKAE